MIETIVFIIGVMVVGCWVYTYHSTMLLAREVDKINNKLRKGDQRC